MDSASARAFCAAYFDTSEATAAVSSAHFFDRAREPLIERTVHQAIGEPEHHDDGKEREQQSAHHQASAKLRSQDAQPPFREKFQKISRQNETSGPRTAEISGW